MSYPTWHTSLSCCQANQGRIRIRIRFTPSPASQRSSIHHRPCNKSLRIRGPRVPRPPRRRRSHLRPPQLADLSPGKEHRGELLHRRLPPDPTLRDWDRRQRRPAMAIPLVLVVLPLGLLFLLSGLIVNTIQVASLPHRGSARFVCLFHFGRRPR